MQARVFIVQREDGLVRAMARLLESHGYRVRVADGIDALRDELEHAERPAVLLVDEDDAGPDWREQLGTIPADVPRVLLTWYPGVALPQGVMRMAKPFSVGELLEAISRESAASRPATYAPAPRE